jgi:hypothetical protein
MADINTKISEPLTKKFRDLQWWPSLIGLTFAGLASYGMTSGQELAPVLAGSAVLYVGTSAMQNRAFAWPIFFSSLVVGGLCSILLDIDTTLTLVSLGAVLVIFGLLRGVSGPVDGFPLQALAMIVFGAAALFALNIDTTVGSCLVAFGLFAHAAWDVYHHWTDRVVSRSAAEFCFVLDVALGAIILISL